MSLFNRSLLSVYGLAWKAARPFLARHHRLASDFQKRLVPHDWPFGAPGPTENAPCLWVQAASGGEAWLALSLAQSLAALAPQGARLTLLLTTFTRQGLDVLEAGTLRHAEDWAAAGFTLTPRYLPLDAPDLMEKAMRRVSPKAVVLLETELWPGLLTAARRQGVPMLALNARMSAKSLAGYQWISSFWKEHAPQRIMAISDDDGRRFASLFGPERVSLMPNIKFDRTAAALVPAPGQKTATDPVLMREQAGLPEDLPLMALSSVRQDEEALLLPVLENLFNQGYEQKPVSLVLAPRHMHRAAYWEKNLARAGIPFARRSDRPAPLQGSRPPLLLWDTFGELQALYGLADAVFVGGSLAPLGGQNFLEPLAAGVTPIVGPHWKNFHWVGEDIFTIGLARRVDQARQLAPALLDSLRDIAEHGGTPGTPSWQTAGIAARAKTQDRFRVWLTPRTGGALAAAAETARFLDW